MRTTGNTVLVTGGATGIGFGLAEAFHRRGNAVLLAGRREDRLREAAERLPGARWFACDVADPEQRRALADWAMKDHPDVNVLVNNAGIQRDIDLTKGVEELASGGDELRIDLEAPIWLSQLFVPHLAGKDDAAIVHVTSGIAFVPSVKAPLYSTTKAALHVFSQVQRKQLRAAGIRVFEVAPPLILDTELNPEGRAKARAAAGGVPDAVRYSFMDIPTSAKFAEHVLARMEEDVEEIGYGTSEESIRLSKGPLERIFNERNP